MRGDISSPLLEEGERAVNDQVEVADDGVSSPAPVRKAPCLSKRTKWTLVIAASLSFLAVTGVVGYKAWTILHPSQDTLHPDPAPGIRCPERPNKPLLVSANFTSLALSWTQPPAPDAEVIQDEIQYSRDGKVFTRGFLGLAVSCAVHGLDPSSDYHLRLRMRNNVGPSEWSEVVVFTTAKPIAPRAPDVPFPSNSSETSMSVVWRAPPPSGSPVSAYTLCTEPQVDGRSCAVVNGTRHTFDHLASATAYHVTVSARNGVGSGPASEPLVSHTDHSVLSKPSSTKVAVTERGVVYLQLGWEAVTDDGGAVLLGYESEIAEMPAGLWQRVPNGGRPLGRQVTATGLRGNVTYAVRVRSWNHGSFSDWSAAVTATTLPPQVPGPPSLPALVSTSPTSLGVRWDASVGNGEAVEAYDLQMDDWWDDSDFSTKWTGVSLNYTESSSLLPASHYRIRVGARNSLGFGTWSPVSSFYTDVAGYCGNDADLKTFKSTKTTMKKGIQKCLIGCALDKHRDSCAAKCINKDIGLSMGCAGCWVAEGECTISSCALACLNPGSSKCADCSRKHCFPDCVTCSGVPDWAYPA